jgi:hypothetical protein
MENINKTKIIGIGLAIAAVRKYGNSNLQMSHKMMGYEIEVRTEW